MLSNGSGKLSSHSVKLSNGSVKLSTDSVKLSSNSGELNSSSGAPSDSLKVLVRRSGALINGAESFYGATATSVFADAGLALILTWFIILANV